MWILATGPTGPIFWGCDFGAIAAVSEDIDTVKLEFADSLDRQCVMKGSWTMIPDYLQNGEFFVIMTNSDIFVAIMIRSMKNHCFKRWDFPGRKQIAEHLREHVGEELRNLNLRRL